MSDLKDKLKLSRKDRIKKLLNKMNSGEYSQEARKDANKYVGETYDSLDEDEREEFAEEELKRKRKEKNGNKKED